MMETDINWPQALRATDSGQQSAAVRELLDVLLRGLRVALGGRDGVNETHLEDFAQDGLLRVLSQLDQFQGRSRFTTWAQAIALNTAFAELRRKRWQDVSLDALMTQGEQLAELAALPDDIPGNGEERTRILAALRVAIAEDLTPKQRAAILAALRELPFDQIAALLGANRNAAYKLVHDARRALKHGLHRAGITAQDIRTAFNV